MGKWRSAEQLAEDARQRLARAEARAEKRSRGDDTRRKILLGSWLLTQISNDKVKGWVGHGLDGFLTRQIDRDVLRDLLPEQKPSAVVEVKNEGGGQIPRPRRRL